MATSNIGVPEGEAACRDADLRLFLSSGRGPSSNEDAIKAKVICAGCSIRRHCLELALRTHERYGIWGGTTPAERRALVMRNAHRAHRSKKGSAS